MSRIHRAAATLAGLGLACSLGACGLDERPPAPSETANTSPRPGAGQIVQDDVHNAQDAAFATAMIIHHRQTLAVVGLAAGRTQNAKLLDLAQRIEAERTPELGEMTRWLAEWKVRVPAPSASTSDGATIPGMISAADVASLTASHDATFDRQFLTLLVDHARGGTRLAQDEIRTGADERARGMADDIAASQESEIAEMQKLLG